MPLFWNDPYRTPYDDALTAYNQVRRQRDHPFYAIFTSRLACAFYCGVGPILALVGYLFFTDLYNQVIHIPSRVEAININLKNALNRSTELQRKIDAVSDGVVATQETLENADKKIEAANDLLDQARAEMSNGFTTVNSTISKHYGDTRRELGLIRNQVSEGGFVSTNLHHAKPVERSSRDQARILVRSEAHGLFVLSAGWVGSNTSRPARSVLLVAEVNGRDISAFASLEPPPAGTSLNDDDLLLSSALAASLGVNDRDTVLSPILIIP